MFKKSFLISKICILCFLFLGLAAGNFSALAGPLDNMEKADFLIGFYQPAGRMERNMVASYGGEVYREFNIVNAMAVRMAPQAARALAQNPGVRYVEPNGPVHALSQKVPWGIERVFGDESYSFDTWETTMGSGIAVAVLDTGIDENHEDLPALLGGINTIDGTDWDTDDNGHGTHVAGTIAALDNELGVVGVGPQIGLYAVKVLDRGGGGTIESVVGGIEWAVGQGIPILNMSLGTGTHYQTLQDACDAAEVEGHLIIASAGNSGNPPGRGENVNYPAKYDSVMAIAASDSSDRRASFSSTGPAVELIAPGVSVLSTVPGNGYAAKSGTSMASPHAAGAAALAWAANSKLTNLEIREILQQTAEDLGLASNHQGYGLVRADLAVRAAADLEPPAVGHIKGTVKNEDGSAIEGAVVSVEGTDLSATTDASGCYLLENVPIGDQEVTASADGYDSQTETVTIEENQTVVQNFTLVILPTYEVSGTVKDTAGNPLADATVTIEETGLSAGTDEGGNYSIDGVEKGDYSIVASKDGYYSQTKSVTVDENTTVNFNLAEITEETQKMHVDSVEMWYRSAGPNRFVYTGVKIVCSEGSSVAKATVNLKMTLPDESVVYLSDTTGDDGIITFEIRSRQTGKYTSSVENVEKDGWEYDWEADKETGKTIDVK